MYIFILNQFPNVVLVLYFVVHIAGNGMCPRPIPTGNTMHILLPWHIHSYRRQHHVLTVQCRPVLHCNGCDFVSEL